MSHLFRDEVIAAQQGSLIGAAHLVRSIPLWSAIAAAFLMAAGLIAFGLIGTYTRKAHVSGVLVPQGGGVNLTAPAAGRIAEVRLAEGASVEGGDVLIVIDTERTTLSKLPDRTEVQETADAIGEKIAIKRAGLDVERRLRTGQAQIRRASIRERNRRLSDEIAKLDDEIALQTQRRQLAETSVRRYEGLVTAGFVSSAQVQGQQEALIDQNTRLRSLERTRLNLQREQAALVSEDNQVESDLAVALAAVDMGIAGLEQEAIEMASRRTSLIMAPQAGTVSAVGVAPGQWVNAGQTLAALHPRGVPLEANLYASSRVCGFVEVGQAVRLRLAAFPYQKFGFKVGTVTEISGSAFASADLPRVVLYQQPANQGAEAVYKIRVTLDSAYVDTYGSQKPLKAGMAVDADILQDRRTIVEWLFEPLIAASKRA